MNFLKLVYYINMESIMNFMQIEQFSKNPKMAKNHIISKTILLGASPTYRSLIFVYPSTSPLWNNSIFENHGFVLFYSMSIKVLFLLWSIITKDNKCLLLVVLDIYASVYLHTKIPELKPINILAFSSTGII